METVTHHILPIGSTFRYGNRKYHVVSYFKDDATNMFGYVIRYYGKWWHYEALTAEDFDLKQEFGLLKNIRKKKYYKKL